MGPRRAPEVWIGAGLFLAVACGGESAKSSSSDASAAGDQAEVPSLAGGDGGMDGGERAGGRGNAAASGGAVSTGGSQGITGGGTSGGRSASGTGGSSAAGGSDAGSGTAGDGGTDGASAGSGGTFLPLPDECVSQNQSEETTKCTLDLTCDGAPVSVVCGGGGDGDWSCSCRGLVSESYSVQASTGGTACAAAAAVCSGKGPIDRNSPEACTTEQTRSAGRCKSSTACRFELDISGSPAVVAPLARVVTCEDVGAGVSSCECPGEPDIAHLFTGFILEEGCDFAERFCSSPTRTALGAPNCEPQASVLSESSCELGRTCQQQVDLDDGTAVTLYSTDYTGCEERGGLRCTCQEQADEFVFERAPTGSVTLDTCWQARDLCNQRDDLVRGSAIECVTTNQASSGLSCQLSLECVQEATIGAVDIGLHGKIQASCYQDQASWTCICLSGTARADIAVESMDDWSACTAAAEACPDLVGDSLSW